MTPSQSGSRVPAIIGTVAILFGILTVASGSRVLFGGPHVWAAAGNVVPFVLWFNVIAGFAYIAAGGGMMARRPWAVWLAAAILATTVIVFLGFALHVAGGGMYEMRTAAAMMVRVAVWSGIVLFASQSIGWK